MKKHAGPIQIEDIAEILLANRVSFNYDGIAGYLKITSKDYDTFDTLSYHADTLKLVAMDCSYNEVPMVRVVNDLQLMLPDRYNGKLNNTPVS